ncbi:MAG: hypothetical protein ING85_05705, partial [Phenylobacterium sp.]|nr:hypothetical protein [Phenylobacterium sp.]
MIPASPNGWRLALGLAAALVLALAAGRLWEAGLRVWMSVADRFYQLPLSLVGT